MAEEEVKKEIGIEHWSEFIDWMRGQTCGLNEDGSIDYFKCDVEAFKTKLKTKYDRQKDFYKWD